MKRWALLGLVFLGACRAQEEAQAEEGEEGDEFAQKKWRDEVGKHSYCAEDNCYDLLGVTKVCRSPQRSPDHSRGNSRVNSRARDRAAGLGRGARAK